MSMSGNIPQQLNEGTQPTGQNTRRDHSPQQRNAKICAGLQLTVSIIGFVFGLIAYVVTDNIKSGAFWAHLAPVIASLFVLIGIHNGGRPWIVAGLVFDGCGIVLCFVGTLVDAVTAGHVSDTDFNRCSYSEHGGSAVCGFDNTRWWATIPCTMPHSAHSCYCCDIYKSHHCDELGFSLSTQPDEYIGIKSCKQVQIAYQSVLWISMTCCLVNFILVIAVFAAVGQYINSTRSVHAENQPPGSATNSTTLMPYAHYGQGPIIFYPHGTVGYRPGHTPTHLFQVPAYTPTTSTQVPQPGGAVSSDGTSGSSNINVPTSAETTDGAVGGNGICYMQYENPPAYSP